MFLKTLLLLSIGFIVVSCSETIAEKETTVTQPKQIKEIVIHIKDGNDELQEVFNSSVKEEFQIFSDLISSEIAPDYKCGYNGDIIYAYHDGSLRDCDFNLDESCNHIVYMEDGDLVSRKITPEGREALLLLMEKGGIIVSSGVELPMIPDEPEMDMEKLTEP